MNKKTEREKFVQHCGGKGYKYVCFKRKMSNLCESYYTGLHQRVDR